MNNGKKKSWRRRPAIKHPYTVTEFIIDILAGGQAGLIFTFTFVIKPEKSDFIFIPACGAYLVALLHYTIIKERNRSLYAKNKAKREAQRGA